MNPGLFWTQHSWVASGEAEETMRWGLLMSSGVEPPMVMVGFLRSKSVLRQLQMRGVKPQMVGFLGSKSVLRQVLGRGLGVEPPPEHSRLFGYGLLSFLLHPLSSLLSEYTGALHACLPAWTICLVNSPPVVTFVLQYHFSETLPSLFPHKTTLSPQASHISPQRSL